MTAVVDADGSVLGIFTDGDLRRALDQPIDIQHRAHGRRHDRESEDDRAATSSRPRPCT